MMQFKENLSFAILVNDVAWRADLTTRYCEYFAHRFNAEKFSEIIYFPDNVDDAIERCKTDYMIILSGGFIPFNDAFFDELKELAEENKNMFIGQVVLDHDFAYIDEQFIFVNKPLWEEFGRPKYAGKNREGLAFDSSNFTFFNKLPNTLLKVETADSILVPHECLAQGGEMIVAQLKKIGWLRTLRSLTNSNYHFLNNRTPYLEIHSETEFEKLFIEKNRIHAIGNNDFSKFERKPIDILVTPADGIRGLILAQELKVNNVVIFSKSPAALEFQKLLFTQESPKLFGEIVKEFKEKFPSLVLPKNFYESANYLIHPFKGQKEFVIADCTSFEMEELIKKIDHKQTVLFDFSNIFVLPHNYYRRPLYQIQALFAEIYSLIKSRTGPSYLAGIGPKFVDLYKIDVNTSNAQFELDIQSALEMDEMPEVFFKPDLSALRIKDEEIKQNWFTTVAKAVETVISCKNEHKALHDNKAIDEALNTGYSIISEENNIILVAKEEKLEDISIIYFYGINPVNSEWKFFVGKKNSEKRIEFSNGISIESCIKHINQPIKINIKTAIKYFQ